MNSRKMIVIELMRLITQMMVMTALNLMILNYIYTV